MGYWGQAMTYIHPLWSDPPSEAQFETGRALAGEARARGTKTAWEEAYIAAVGGYYAQGWSRDEKANLWSRLSEHVIIRMAQRGFSCDDVRRVFEEAMNETNLERPAEGKPSDDRRCVVCTTGVLEEGRKIVTIEREGTTIVTRQVPGLICRVCGEGYFDEDVAGRLLELIEEAVAAHIEVDVRRYMSNG